MSLQELFLELPMLLRLIPRKHKTRCDASLIEIKLWHQNGIKMISLQNKAQALTGYCKNLIWLTCDNIHEYQSNYALVLRFIEKCPAQWHLSNIHLVSPWILISKFLHYIYECLCICLSVHIYYVVYANVLLQYSIFIYPYCKFNLYALCT